MMTDFRQAYEMVRQGRVARMAMDSRKAMFLRPGDPIPAPKLDAPVLKAYRKVGFDPSWIDLRVVLHDLDSDSVRPLVPGPEHILAPWEVL